VTDSQDKADFTQPANLKDAVELTAKLVAGLAIVCYAFGLISTNLYLAKFGITDFSVLRPKCIVTGGWVLSVILISSAPFLITLYRQPPSLTKPNYQRVFIHIGRYLVASIIPWIVLVSFVYWTSQPFDLDRDYLSTASRHDWSQASVISFLFMIFGLILGGSAKSTVYAIRSKFIGPLLIVRAAALLISMLAIVSLFVYVIFPGLPSSLAGGEIEKVTLLTNEAHLSALQELGIMFNSSKKCPHLSDVVGLVYETDHNILIQRFKLPPTLLDRSLVDAIVRSNDFKCDGP
jgi:hypothetical protein